MSWNPIVARLLAQENLTVMEANVPTACFDVKERVLLVPNLLPKFEGCKMMLYAHEVGHALYTTEEFNDIFIAASSTMKQYYNICEDVRVEKLIKRKYPGLRRVMAEGYEIFNSNNYFLPPNIDVNTLTLIDRINAYFKIGHHCYVDFTPEERLLAEEVENTESVDDVIVVAKKIFAFVKDQLSKQPEPKREEEVKEKREESDESDEGTRSNDDGEESKKSESTESTESESTESESTESESESTESESTESESTESESTESESTESESSSKTELSDEEIDKAMRSITQTALDDGLIDAADLKTNVVNLTIETKFAKDPIYSYKHMLKNMTDESRYYYGDVGTRLKEKAIDFEKFTSSTNRIVAHMVKEFEMKKCAHKQRRAQVSKTGQLNINKLFAYKIKDELFKSITTIADDKNHGMIFLVDWSGSMSQHLEDTLCQLMSLAMFCRKAKIPFSVRAFSDNLRNEDLSNTNRSCDNILKQSHIDATATNTLMSNAGYGIQLLELMSEKMNEREFTRMLKLLHSGVVQGFYSLGGTPLNESLIYMHSYVAKYKKLNNIEKLTFVVLTDGQGDKIYYKSMSGGLSSIGYGSRGICKIVDPITKDVYDISYLNITQILLKMIKKSSQCQVIGFYVCGGRDLYNALRQSFPDAEYDNHRLEVAKSEFRKVGYSALKNCGYDKLYLVNAPDLGENEYVPKYDEDMSAASLAKEMIKQNTASVSNKMLMGKVIGEFSIGIST